MQHSIDLDIILVNKINSAKTLVDKAKKSFNTENSKKKTLALAYINEASSFISVAEAVYYSQFDILMRNDYEDLFNDFHNLVNAIFDAYDKNSTITENSKFFVAFENSYEPFSKIKI